MDPSTIQIIIMVILVMMSAYFSATETAFSSLNKTRLKTLAEDGNKKAALTLKLAENYDKLISTILIGNNIVNIFLASLGTIFFIHMVTDENLGTTLSTVVITLVVLIFGEITPKTVATINAEKMALTYAYPIHVIMVIITPINMIINLLSKIVFFILRVDPNAKINAVTEDELRTMVEMGHEDGAIEEEEREMINNVFDLGDAKAKDVMVPGVHVIFADVDSSYDELIEIFRENKFTRLPVFEEKHSIFFCSNLISVYFCIYSFKASARAEKYFIILKTSSWSKL